MKQLPIWLHGHDTKSDHRRRYLAVFYQGSGQQSVTNVGTATLVLVAYVVVVLCRSEYVRVHRCRFETIEAIVQI